MNTRSTIETYTLGSLGHWKQALRVAPLARPAVLPADTRAPLDKPAVAPMRRPFPIVTPLLVSIAVMASLSGCNRWNWRGRGFEDESVGWTKNMRPAADEKQFSGLDSRAREVERNLGVR